MMTIIVRSTRLLLFTVFISILASTPTIAQQPAANYDEAKIPPYTLPDPLIFADGKKVKRARDWGQRRSPELLRIFADQVFG
jgi:hypothetical protein